MCLKIRCDGECEKFCKFFREVNKALKGFRPAARLRFVAEAGRHRQTSSSVDSAVQFNREGEEGREQPDRKGHGRR